MQILSPLFFFYLIFRLVLFPLFFEVAVYTLGDNYVRIKPDKENFFHASIGELQVTFPSAVKFRLQGSFARRHHMLCWRD